MLGLKAAAITLLGIVLFTFAVAADNKLTPTTTYSDYVRARSTPQAGLNFATGLQRSSVESSITLAWDASPQAVGGYYLYYGDSSGNYDSKIDVGDQTVYTLSGLEENRTYHFALTAYDLARAVESDFSNEVSASLAETRNYSGVWFDPQQNGQAVTLLQEAAQISGVWYLYGEDGQGLWLTFAGLIDGDSVSLDLIRFSGPALGTSWDETQLTASAVGTATLTFKAADNIAFAYTLNGINGSLNLAPFSQLTSNARNLAQPFVGAYSGVFSGDDVGVFLVSVAAKGRLSGLAVSSADGVSFALSGTVDGAGAITMNGAGSIFSGTLAIAGDMSGGWINQGNQSRGVFSGNKQP